MLILTLQTVYLYNALFENTNIAIFERIILLNRIVGEVTNDLHYQEDNFMKKLLQASLLPRWYFTIGVMGVFAASSEKGRNTPTPTMTDVGLADGGVCPNGGVRSLDGSGRQNGRGAANRGAGFVDADGDGICDTYPNGGVRPLDGSGRQNGGRRAGMRNK